MKYADFVAEKDRLVRAERAHREAHQHVEEMHDHPPRAHGLSFEGTVVMYRIVAQADGLAVYVSNQNIRDPCDLPILVLRRIIDLREILESWVRSGGPWPWGVDSSETERGATEGLRKIKTGDVVRIRATEKEGVVGVVNGERCEVIWREGGIEIYNERNLEFVDERSGG